jgi:tripartite-type tricarboxylate transporter receptor subunit TctC
MAHTSPDPRDRGRRAWLAQAAACGVGLLGRVSLADATYPSRLINILVGFGAGSAPDILVRLVATELARRMGQPVVVENKPGAAGNLAAAAAAKSPPDGHTLFYGTNTTHAINPSLYSKLPFDHIRDFEPITLSAKVWNVLLVNPQSGPKDFPALVAAAKSRPGKLMFGSSGNGTSLHLTGEMLKQRLGLDIVHVPYKTGEASMIDLSGGRIDMLFANTPPALAHIQSGRLRAIAVTSLQRSAQLPSVPTLNELGVKDFEVSGWGGFFAPALTPRNIVDALNRHLQAILQDPAVVAQMNGWGVTPQTSSPQAFAEFIKSETVRWREVIRVSGAKID